MRADYENQQVAGGNNQNEATLAVKDLTLA